MSGDARRERFEDIYRAHYGSVRAYALRRADTQAAQDAVAETFLVAWRRLDAVPADELPWLYGVARKVLANQRRSSRRSERLARRLAETDPDGDTPGPEEGVVEADAVRRALATLGERDRDTLMLVAWEGLEGARAARAAGCSRSAFAVRLHRARRRLADELRRAAAPPSPADAETLEAR